MTNILPDILCGAGGSGGAGRGVISQCWCRVLRSALSPGGVLIHRCRHTQTSHNSQITTNTAAGLSSAEYRSSKLSQCVAKYQYYFRAV